MRTRGAGVERFSREELDITAPIWRDKRPSLAEPTMVWGRFGSIKHLPRSGSCVRFLRDSLPQATSFPFCAILARSPPLSDPVTVIADPSVIPNEPADDRTLLARARSAATHPECAAA
jgi:hypothetical protein